MEPFILRYRNPLVLLLMLAAQIIGLAVQVRHTETGRNLLDAPDGSGVRLIRLWAEGLVAPPERLIHGIKIGGVALWQDYLDLHRVRQQNQELQTTIDRLRLEQASLMEDAKQGQRLQGILDFQEKYVYKTVAAQAIGSSGTDQSRVFYIDKGKNYGIEPDMAVITADGIVGKVREVGSNTAQVLAINDQTAGAGVILETTRIRGILRGNALGQPQIVGVLADQRIQPGEKVLTAGGDQIFPRGLPVGVVEKVLKDPERDSFINVIVKPAAHLDRLDEVLVITSTLPRFSPQQEQDLATSQALKGPVVEAAKEQAIKDQLAQEQKKAAELMAERLPGLIDPNLPADQQPLHETASPTIPTHAPQAIHSDRFTPGASANAANAPVAASAPNAPAGATPSKKPAVTTPAAAQTAHPGNGATPPPASKAPVKSSANPPRRIP
jgi:rod shape-determining protein MreC